MHYAHSAHLHSAPSRGHEGNTAFVPSFSDADEEDEEDWDDENQRLYKLNGSLYATLTEKCSVGKVEEV